MGATAPGSREPVEQCPFREWNLLMTQSHTHSHLLTLWSRFMQQAHDRQQDCCARENESNHVGRHAKILKSLSSHSTVHEPEVHVRLLCIC